MAGPWDTPPTDAERVDPWAAPPTEAERVAPGPVAAAPAPSSAPGGGGLQALMAHFADNVPGARQLATAAIAARMGLGGSPMGFGENYRQLRLTEDRDLRQSRAESPWASRLGSLMGFGATAAAAPASSVAGLAGLGGATGLSDSTNDPGAGLGDITRRTAISAVLAPIMGKSVEVVSPYVASTLGRGASAAERAAGWLKVNSIHPNPKLGEAMEEIPGGKIGVGLELLKRGIGGLTKGGTAKQTEVAKEAAGKVIDTMAGAYDSAGGKPIDLTPALEDGLQHAAKLQAEPLKRAAGQKLEDLIYQYAQKYQGAPVPASEALALKRALADAAYKHGVAASVGDTVAGEYGAGLGRLERSVDDALDQHLGPAFGEANLAYRRLLKATAAADRQEGRGVAGHVAGGLLPMLASVGGAAGAGHAGGDVGAMALGAGFGTLMLGKYGSQAGARTLYSPVAGTLGGLGELMSRAPEFGSRFAAGRAGAAYPTLAEIFGQRPSPASVRPVLGQVSP